MEPGASFHHHRHAMSTRTVTLSAEHWQRISDALLDCCDEGPPGEGWKSPGLSSAVAALDAALAQPEPVGVTDEDAVALYSVVMALHDCQTLGDMAGNFARAVLTRWGRSAITPIPVSERLPGAEDCDAEGFCWWFSAADPTVGTFGIAACWVLRKHEPDDDDWRTHWLPHWALPLPPSDHL